MNKIQLKNDDSERVEAVQRQLQDAILRKANAKTPEERLEAAAAFDEAKALSREVRALRNLSSPCRCCVFYC